MSGLTIRIVLDHTAIDAFTYGNIDVGEVLAEVADEPGCGFGLPVLCMVEATRRFADSDRLDLLVNHPAAQLLTPDPHSWRALAVAFSTLEAGYEPPNVVLAAASAVLAAIDLGCHVLTGKPDQYEALAGGGPIIPF